MRVCSELNPVRRCRREGSQKHGVDVVGSLPGLLRSDMTKQKNRAPISQEAILAAIHDLVDKGLEPTYKALNVTLGGCSNSTISPVLSAWRAEQRKGMYPNRPPLPPRLQERVLAVTRELWVEASEIANQHLAEERQALEAVSKGLERDRDEALELADNQTEELEALREQLDHTEEKLLRMTQQAAEQGKRLSQLHDELMTVRQEAQIMSARAQALVENTRDLRIELHRARVGIDAERTRRQREGEEWARRLMEEKETTRQKVEEVQRDRDQRTAEMHDQIIKAYAQQQQTEDLLASEQKRSRALHEAWEVERTRLHNEIVNTKDLLRTAEVKRTAAEGVLEGLQGRITLLEHFLEREPRAISPDEGIDP